jgi:hypothetical protein
VDEAAVYPGALSQERISAHWTAGDSRASSPCVATSTGPYAKAVLADKPARYFRMEDLANEPATRVAFDSSGHCTSESPTNGSYTAEEVESQPLGALIEGDAGVSFVPNPFRNSTGALRASANALSFPCRPVLTQSRISGTPPQAARLATSFVSLSRRVPVVSPLR